MAPTAKEVKILGKDYNPGVDSIEEYPPSEDER
jgi:hypothetical protein